MPALIRRLNAAGLSAVDYEASSLAQAALHEPDAGVYTVSNTLNITQTLLLDAHLDRLEDSARRKSIDLRYNRRQLRRALRRMIVESGFGDVRFRISAAPSAPDTLLLSIEPYQAPAAALIQNGVHCSIARCTRQDPAAKSSDWMRLRRDLIESVPTASYEILLVDAEDQLLEGATSNFYALINGRLRTAGHGMLYGIARRVVLEVAQGIIPVSLQAPKIHDLARMDEAFISSSSRGIIPVARIDDHAIGGGAVGEMTKSLRRAYQSWVADHLEEL